MTREIEIEIETLWLHTAEALKKLVDNKYPSLPPSSRSCALFPQFHINSIHNPRYFSPSLPPALDTPTIPNVSYGSNLTPTVLTDMSLLEV